MTHDAMIAVIAAHRDGKLIQYKHEGWDRWGDSTKPEWNFACYDYRVKPVKKRSALTEADLPKQPFWTLRPGDMAHCLCGGICGNHIWLGNEYGYKTAVSLESLMESEWMFSTDRTNWKPFYKEVE